MIIILYCKVGNIGFNSHPLVKIGFWIVVKYNIATWFSFWYSRVVSVDGGFLKNTNIARRYYNTTITFSRAFVIYLHKCERILWECDEGISWTVSINSTRRDERCPVHIYLSTYIYVMVLSYISPLPPPRPPPMRASTDGFNDTAFKLHLRPIN